MPTTFNHGKSTVRRGEDSHLHRCWALLTHAMILATTHIFYHTQTHIALGACDGSVQMLKFLLKQHVRRGLKPVAKIPLSGKAASCIETKTIAALGFDMVPPTHIVASQTTSKCALLDTEQKVIQSSKTVRT
jgi:hypothetical protein